MILDVRNVDYFYKSQKKKQILKDDLRKADFIRSWAKAVQEKQHFYRCLPDLILR